MSRTYLSFKIHLDKAGSVIAGGYYKTEEEAVSDLAERYPKAFRMEPIIESSSAAKDTICGDYLQEWPAAEWPYCAYCGQEKGKHPVKADTNEGRDALQFIANPMPRMDSLPMD